MPHSLKSKVKSLCYKGELSEKERDKIIHALEQTRPTGKWIDDIAYYDLEGCPCCITRCNQCGREHPVSNYCPNCGADMRGEDNDD